VLHLRLVRELVSLIRIARKWSDVNSLSYFFLKGRHYY